jgi:hypothetical protein
MKGSSMFAKFAIAIAIVASFIAGAFVQLTFDAAQDCKRDSIAFADACEYANAHPVLTAWFNR